MWYGLERTIVEGLRTDSLYVPFAPIRVSQVLSLLLLIAGAVLTAIMFMRRKTTKSEK